MSDLEFDEYDENDELKETSKKSIDLCEYVHRACDTSENVSDIYEDSDVSNHNDSVKSTSKWDGNFDGSYERSRYNDGTLETDILNMSRGIYAGPSGELIRESVDRIDVWGIGENGDYPHYYLNNITGEVGKAPGGRHNR